jgi:DNA-directed RNA polymerase specialized sigma subunit
MPNDDQLSFKGMTPKRLDSLAFGNASGSTDTDATTNKAGVGDDVFNMGAPKNVSSETFASRYAPVRTIKPVRDTTPRRPEPNKLSVAYQNWSHNKSPQAMDDVLTHARDVIEKGITTYSGTDSPLMRSRARVIAAQAIQSYDPNSKANLSSWIMTNLQGLTRYRQQTSPIRVPERVQYELHAVNQANQELTDELGREPTMSELADRTGLSSKRIDYVRRFNRSIRTEGSFVDEEGGTYLPGVAENSWQNVWAEFVYHDLDPTNKQIYDMIVRKGASVNDAAAKLKMSASAVSQRAKKIADMISEADQVKL